MATVSRSSTSGVQVGDELTFQAGHHIFQFEFAFFQSLYPHQIMVFCFDEMMNHLIEIAVFYA